MPFGLPGLTAAEHRRAERAGWSRARRAKAPRRAVARWRCSASRSGSASSTATRSRSSCSAATPTSTCSWRTCTSTTTRSATTSSWCARPRRRASRCSRSPARRPVDDPGVARVYYRLVPERETHRRQDAHALRARARRAWRAGARCSSTRPTRSTACRATAPRRAANPFTTFAALPVAARYRFMLDEAEFTIMGFIKGPVCRGQMALDVIDDRFWVVFLAPSKRLRRSAVARCWRARPTCCACPPAAATRGPDRPGCSTRSWRTTI